VFGIQTCSAPVARGGAAAALETVAAGAAVLVALVTEVVAGARTADVAELLVACVAERVVATAAVVAAGAVAATCADEAESVVVPTAVPPHALRRASAPAGRMIAVNARRRERRPRT